MNMLKPRTIFINDPFGIRQIKETLSNLLIASCVTPTEHWLVSAWLTDFDLLDNRSGDWDHVNPNWGHRFVKFSEMIIYALNVGATFYIVTNEQDINSAFIKQLKSSVNSNASLHTAISESMHKKGLLTNSFYLSGSMNFTYSGTHRNQEEVKLTVERNSLFETKLEFEKLYMEKFDV